MRTGPVALFTRLAADFLIVHTEPDPETSIWRQPWEELGWTPIEDMEAMRSRVPGRDYGQANFSVDPTDVDWSQWDIVISIDVAVPARVTRRFPSVVWAYYVREPKTSAWKASHSAPLAGMDIFLNQGFRLKRSDERPGHEVEFPYFLQYWGCFHELLDLPLDARLRAGIFLEHHTPEHLSEKQLRVLERWGPVDSTAMRLGNGFAKGNVKCDRSAETILRSLVQKKYFIKQGRSRNVWGNATVEAVAAGCLCLGDPRRHVHQEVFDRHTSARTFDELIDRIKRLEGEPPLFQQAVDRQRSLIDQLCWERPMLELLQKAEEMSARKGQ